MPAVVLGLLGGHVVFIMVAITLATGDRSLAVVPDYYGKAVDYDQRKADLADSAALGWQAEFQPSATISLTGERDLLVVLRDREGAAVEGASLGVSCYHFARASDPLTIEFSEVLPGQYVGKARLAREGFWQFELEAQRGSERFVSETKQFVPKAEARQ